MNESQIIKSIETFDEDAAEINMRCDVIHQQLEEFEKSITMRISDSSFKIDEAITILANMGSVLAEVVADADKESILRLQQQQ